MAIVIENERKLNLDWEYFRKIRAIIIEKGYDSLVKPLDMLTDYVFDSFECVVCELKRRTLTDERKKEILGMLRTMERKYTHML